MNCLLFVAYKKTEPIIKQGDEVIFFGRLENITLIAPVPEFTLGMTNWNCKLIQKTKVLTQVTFDIVPDFFNFSRFGDSARWYICLWVEYSGIVANAPRICDLMNRKAALEEDKKLQIQKQKENKLYELQADATISSTRDRLEMLGGAISFLNREFFQLDQIDQLFNVLSKDY